MCLFDFRLANVFFGEEDLSVQIVFLYHVFVHKDEFPNTQSGKPNSHATAESTGPKKQTYLVFDLFLVPVLNSYLSIEADFALIPFRGFVAVRYFFH